MKPTCMNCKHYKVEDVLSGYCRAKSAERSDQSGQKARVSHDHTCPSWVDCGQHYYIRLGWLKTRQTPDTRQ